MGNVYSAHNIAAYFIEELNGMNKFINERTLQQLLAETDAMWQKAFGHCAYHEQASPNQNTYIGSIQREYNHHGQNHIQSPELEWYLPYGSFQLVRRPYEIIEFTSKERIILYKVIAQVYRTQQKALAV